MIGGWFQRWRGRFVLGSAKALGKVAPVPRVLSGNGVKPGAGQPWLDLSVLMAIGSLEIRVQRMLQGLHRGLHRSLRRGYSAEFAEYRSYTPGDDLRHLDWRRMARTDRPYVRQYEDESDWSCLMVIDLSASMAFGTVGYSKAEYARTLAGTLAAALQGQGDPVGFLRFGSSVEGAVPPSQAPRQMARWWALLSAQPAGSEKRFGEVLEEARRMMRRQGLVVLVSDLLVPEESWGNALRLLRAAGHEVVIVEVLDPQETAFEYVGDTRFVGLEEVVQLDLDATAVRLRYLEKMNAHRLAVETLCARENVLFWRASTAMPLEPLLREIITGVSNRRERSVPRGASERGRA
jgi:uncharacterized protein (DUF58 family)